VQTLPIREPVTVVTNRHGNDMLDNARLSWTETSVVLAFGPSPLNRDRDCQHSERGGCPLFLCPELAELRVHDPSGRMLIFTLVVWILD